MTDTSGTAPPLPPAASSRYAALQARPAPEVASDILRGAADKAFDEAATVHQAGTVRFGTDPAASVLDVHCRAHDLDNLYVVDGSFMPSIGAVNPTLTIIANALRVGDHIAERLGTSLTS